MINGKKILDTDICQIFQDGAQYRVLIQMSNGGWIEHQPFPGDLKGLIAALDLSLNVLSGKFWVQGVFTPAQPKEAPKFLNGGNNAKVRSSQ